MKSLTLSCNSELEEFCWFYGADMETQNKSKPVLGNNKYVCTYYYCLYIRVFITLLLFVSSECGNVRVIKVVLFIWVLCHRFAIAR